MLARRPLARDLFRDGDRLLTGTEFRQAPAILLRQKESNSFNY
jgi:hypothetical protein